MENTLDALVSCIAWNKTEANVVVPLLHYDGYYVGHIQLLDPRVGLIFGTFEGIEFLNGASRLVDLFMRMEGRVPARIHLNENMDILIHPFVVFEPSVATLERIAQ